MAGAPARSPWRGRLLVPSKASCRRTVRRLKAERRMQERTHPAIGPAEQATARPAHRSPGSVVLVAEFRQQVV
jgi:hypothetical protein